MSWSSIIKKSINEKKPEIVKPLEKKKKKKIVLTSTYKPTYEELFEFYDGTELLDHLIDIKFEMEKYNSLLFTNANAGEIYKFFKQFISIKEGLVESESDDDILEEEYE